jgi:hypothetical protein
MATDREKEMAAMRARYAALRGKKLEASPEEVKVEVEEAVVVKRPKLPNPYIVLIKGDIINIKEKILKMLGKKERKKPLDLTWLEKNGGKLFK